MSDQGGQEPGRGRLLQRADLGWIILLTLIGLVLRLSYFSGWGLGDDFIHRNFIANLLHNHTVQPDNTAYRFTWWFPTALYCRVLGLSELGMILPITTIATLGVPLLYAFGKLLWGQAGAVVAALLLLVHPLDFAWSTMLASDIFCSFFSGLAMFFVLRALELEEVDRKRRAWIGAGVSLWLAFHAKVAAVLLAPAIVLACVGKRRALDRQVGYFVATAGLLFGATCLVSYVFSGDPLAPYNAEIHFQGLRGEVAVKFHRLGAWGFWMYLRTLFLPSNMGNFLHSVYPHLLLAFLVVGWLLRIRTSGVVWAWLLFVFLGMQFNIQRAEGVWVAGFRNIRHTHVFIYPMVLLLTGYLIALRTRHARLGHTAIAVLVVFGLWQSISTAWKTHVAFDDPRRASHFIQTLPTKTVYSDFQLDKWATILDVRPPFRELIPVDRRAEIARIPSGYLVTGGAREPYYGCIDCIPRADEVTGDRWRLLKEFPGPAEPTWWRPEPLRVWEAVKPPGPPG